MRLPYQKTLIAVCLIGFLICMALIFGGCASTKTGTRLNIGVVASGVADLATTRYAINRGAVEANPLMGQSLLQQALVKAAGVGLIFAGTAVLENKGKVVTAHVLRVITIAAWSFVSLQNVRVGQQ